MPILFGALTGLLEMCIRDRQHADQLAQTLQDACAALHDDGGALDLIARSVADLMHQQGIDDELDELAARLDGQMRDLEDLTRDLSAYKCV